MMCKPVRAFQYMFSLGSFNNQRKPSNDLHREPQNFKEELKVGLKGIKEL